MRLLVLFLLIHPLFLSRSISAQEQSPSVTVAGSLARVSAVADTLDSDEREAHQLSAPFVMSKSPLLAMGLSAILPGAGQFYNQSYWKIPIALGLGVYFASEWIRNNNLVKDYRERYAASFTPSLPFGDGSLLALRDFYKDQRDTFAWYFLILYIANVVDAYVDANLYDFDVGDNLSLRVVTCVAPNPGESFRINVTIAFSQ